MINAYFQQMDRLDLQPVSSLGVTHEDCFNVIMRQKVHQDCNLQPFEERSFKKRIANEDALGASGESREHLKLRTQL